jgi:hypothetical protein
MIRRGIAETLWKMIEIENNNSNKDPCSPLDNFITIINAENEDK